MAAQVTAGLQDVGMPRLGPGRGSGARWVRGKDRAEGENPQDPQQGPHGLSAEVGAPRSARQPRGDPETTDPEEGPHGKVQKPSPP